MRDNITRLSKAHEGFTTKQNRETNRAIRQWVRFAWVMKLAGWLAARAAKHTTLANVYDQDRKAVYTALQDIRARHESLPEVMDTAGDEAKAQVVTAGTEAKKQVKAAAKANAKA